MTLGGRCHCGAIEVSLETARPTSELPLRACQCTFCRRHGARTTSDPEGRARIVLHRPEEVIRYRFGLRTADFLVCGRCGIYVAAVMTEGDAAWAVVNLNVLEPPATFARAATPVSYASEDEGARRTRRRSAWTPASIVLAA